MKIFFCFIFSCLFASISVQAQSPLPKSGNRYSLKDTSKPAADTSAQVNQVTTTSSSVDSQVVNSIQLTGNTTPPEERIANEDTPAINQVAAEEVKENVTEEIQSSPAVDAQVVESNPPAGSTIPAEVVVEKVETPNINPVVTEQKQSTPSVDSKVIESTTDDGDADAAVQAVGESKPPVIRQAAEPVKKATTTSSDGPIRAWSNPPGYMGSQKKVTMVKKKNKRHKNSGIHGKSKKPKGCYD